MTNITRATKKGQSSEWHPWQSPLTFAVITGHKGTATNRNIIPAIINPPTISAGENSIANTAIGMAINFLTGISALIQLALP